MMIPMLFDRAKALSRISLVVLSFFLLICVSKLYLSHIAYPKSSGIPGLLSRKNIDYLFIGSSLTRQSYDMKLINEQYKLDAYAATYNSLSPAMAYKILKYALEDGKVRVGTVVMEAYPYKLLYSPTAIEDVRLFNSAPVKIKQEIVKDMYEGDHDLLRIYDLVFLADNDYLLSWPLTYKVIEKLSHNGGYLYKNVPGLARFNRNIELPVAGNVNQVQYQCYRELADLCKRHKVKIIFIEPFVPKYVQHGRNYSLSKEAVKHALSGTGSVLYDNDMMNLDNDDPSLFGDDIHLSTKGRELWSREIMRVIGKGTQTVSPAL